MKRLIVVLLAALLLAGCSRETQVWLPEEKVVELQGKDVVRIPMGAETEPLPTESAPEPTEATEPVPTQPVETEKATITKKPTTTPKKNTSTSTTAKKETVTATGAPVSTEPPITEPPTYDISDYRVGNLEYEMLDRINEYRAAEELEPLRIDEWLCAIASYRSFEASQVWSHTRPDGRHFATVLDDYGYAASVVQELMVYDTGSIDAPAVADRWMESGTQRELLLSDYTSAGIGLYRLGGLIYVTCLLIQ